jgi:hypothetical protein
MEFPSATVRINRPHNHLSSLVQALALIAFTTISVSGCGRHDDGRDYRTTAPLMLAKAAASSQGTSTLSREHTVVVDVPETELADGFRRVADRCTSDSVPVSRSSSDVAQGSLTDRRPATLQSSRGAAGHILF